MTLDQLLILGILSVTVALFLWGKWRHDMVALASLLACIVAGLVPHHEAFDGFGHPAVITVACVLVLSHGLQTTGAVHGLARSFLPAKAGPIVSMATLVGIGAALSGVMNNVGAMALLMPVAMQMAGRLELPPGKILMPLAFGTILGGMTTMIGTPPNLIVAGFREEIGVGGFGMFDFTPVGLAVAVAGVAFIVLVGWRLVPARKQAGVEDFESGAYITEARAAKDSKAVGMSLSEVEGELEEVDAQITGLVRNEVRMVAPNPWRRVRAGDILVVEAEADALGDVLANLGLELEEAVAPEEDSEDLQDEVPEDDSKAGEDGAEDHIDDDDGRDDDDEMVLMELAVLPGSALAGHSASDLLLRTRYGLNLLALSREGQRSIKRLRSVRIQSGDLLLIQGPAEVISAFAGENGCVPLAERELRIPDKRKAWTAGGIMGLAVVGAAFGLLPAAVSFAAGVLASMALRTVSLRGVYEAVDWPIIVLLGSLIPVAGAMEATGTADLMARFLLEHVAQGHAVLALALILVVTMFLSDLMNNAATAAVMCPIAIGTAAALGVNPDTFLMAVAIGASCAFVTPIGHQNNTLILGPGGFRFGDYWKLGLPMEILVVAVGLPLLLLVWPL